jgi:hypothetical protein
MREFSRLIFPLEERMRRKLVSKGIYRKGKDNK